MLRLKGIARSADGGLYALHGVRHVAYPAQPIESCPAEMENRVVLIADVPPKHSDLLSGNPDDTSIPGQGLR